MSCPVVIGDELTALLVATRQASRSTDACPAFNEYIRDRLRLPIGAASQEAAWKLIVLAVEDSKPDRSGPDENPLLAARYLLALGDDLPQRFHDLVWDRDEMDEVSYAFLWARSHAEIHENVAVDLEKLTGRRQMLAGSTSANRNRRTSWTRDNLYKSAVVEALWDRINELLDGSGVVAQLLESQHSSIHSPRVDIEPATVRHVPEGRRRLRRRTKSLMVLAGVVAVAGGIVAYRSPSVPDPLVLTGSLTTDDVPNDERPIDVKPNDSLVLRIQFTIKDQQEPIDSLRVLLRYSEAVDSPDRQEANIYVSAGELPTFDYLVEGASLPLRFADNSACATAAKPEVSIATQVDQGGARASEIDTRSLEHGFIGQDQGAQLELDDAFAELTVRDVQPGETVQVQVPLQFTDRADAMYTGNTLEFRPVGSQNYRRTGAVERGARIRFRLLVRDYGCSTKPRDPLVRVQFDDSSNGFTKASASVSDPGGTPAAVGETLVNYSGGVGGQMTYVPGSTRLVEAQPPSCKFTTSKMEDGLTQGGLVLKDVYGYRPGEQCDNNVNLNYLYFDARVK